jgi:hypothetical protein
MTVQIRTSTAPRFDSSGINRCQDCWAADFGKIACGLLD